MSTQPLPSLLSLRVLLLSAAGVAAAPGCSGKSEDPDNDIDITDQGPGTVDTGETDTGTPSIPCADAVAITDSAGAASGYVECADGAVLRVSGHTWSDAGLCSTDADCASGQVCIGDEVAGMGGAESYCIPASCETGDDCDSGECGLSTYDDGCGMQATVACRTGDDECRGDAECGDGADQCVVTYWSEEVWVCAGFDCAIGRPLVAGDDGQTPITAGLSVQQARDINASGLEGCPRGELAAWWAHVAQLEHASIASFARVTLELMSLGAPPSLLHEVQRAADDEIRHAAAAFSLASRFSGVRLTPGPLPTAGVVPRQGAEAILRGLIEEACVGETVGVAEARAALAGCTDHRTRAALADIVRDETRHAALAWRTLAWMLERWPELTAVAEASFADATTAMLGAAPPELPHAPTWGLLGANHRRQVREDAVTDVVLPCARAVLARGRARQTAPPRVTQRCPRDTAPT